MIYPWQQHLWQQVQRCVSSQRVAHAWLLTGLPGLGQAEFARHLAELLLCEQPIKNKSGEIAACGMCRSCLLFLAGNHPDYKIVQPQQSEKAIKIDALRQTTHTLSHTAKRSGYQVVVIDSSDNMTAAAANALLKTLEEPSGQVILILITYELHTLLPTIVSRCQRLTFHPSFTRSCAEWLAGQLQVTADQALQALYFCDGAVLNALSLGQFDYKTWSARLINHLLAIARQQAFPLSIVAALLKLDLYWVLKLLLTIVLDLLRMHCCQADPPHLYHADQLGKLRELVTITNPQQLQQQLVGLRQALADHQSKIAINQQLLIENLLLCW